MSQPSRRDEASRRPGGALRPGIFLLLLAVTGAPAQNRSRFWSFQPVRDYPAPAVRDARWVRNDVDAFVLARLEAAGLAPAPPADRRTLLRRVYFDLAGLPPTPSEVAAFLADGSPQAFEGVVERLLASPHYGERWGRHWLDLVRYAETDGHEFDVDKPNAWRYRDYVIRAFNGDLPYNRFVREQLAGDLLSGPEHAPVATGFYWLGEIINTPVDTVQALADRIDNQVDVIGKSLLGLTVACARCHDHKFDPIPTADYYALAGFLHSSRVRQAVIDSPEGAAEMRAAIARIEERPRALGSPAADGACEVFEDFDGPDFGAWTSTGAAFGAGPVRGIADSGRYSAGAQGILISKQFIVRKRFIHVRMAGTGRVKLFADEYTNKSRTLEGGERFEWKTIDARMGVGNIAYLAIEDVDREAWVAVDRICFSEEKAPPRETGQTALLPPPAAAVPVSTFALTTADDLEPKNTRVHLRGNHKTLGAEVPRRFLTVLAGEGQAPVTEGSGRLELARRVTDPGNPLLARVLVNRVWKHHFGRGIVETVDNFGLTGEPPTHRELLDHLAYGFERDWSIKNLHRRMLLSNAYRMASRSDAAAELADPLNKWLHRMPVRRMEAEIVRDNLLAVAGSLDRTLYGPSVGPWVSPYMDGDPRGKPKSGPLDGAGRRSIYIQVRRNYLTDMFLTFDYPLPISTIGKRGVSTVPSQALWMMNSELIAQQAALWAGRTLAAGLKPEARVARLYEEAFARPPEPQETRDIVDFAGAYQDERMAWTDVCHVLLNSTEFVFIR